MTAIPDTPKSVSVMRSAILTIAMRWADRLIGIVSTLILARLLVPADFGIVAMASLVVALVDTLLDLGVNAALVQNRTADHDDFNTAWTLRLAQTALAAALIGMAGAPLASGYFNDPRVESVLWIMALSMLVGGFENIGIVSLQKNMEFGREFKFFFLRRLAGFIVTIVLAFALRNYWAMIFGTLAGRIVGVGLSYKMHGFRPHLSLSKLGNLWSFSQWMLLRNLGTYGAQQIDKILVGRRAGAVTLGAYNLADDISAMPVTELLAPIGRVLFPAFVQVADKPQELRRAFTLALGIQTLIALPAGVGLALVADIAVPLLLGPHWQPAIPLLQILALTNVATALTHSSDYLLLALGKVGLQAFFIWVQFLLLATLLIVGFPQAKAQMVADIRLAVAITAMLLFLIMVIHAVPVLRYRDILASSWRPVFATAAMAATLMGWPVWWPSSVAMPLLAELATKVGAGGTVYIATTLLLWWLGGCKNGAESYLLDKLHPHRATATNVTSYHSIIELPPTAIALMENNSRSNVESTPWWFDNLQRGVFRDDPDVKYFIAKRDGECLAVLPLRYGICGHTHRFESLANYYTSLYVPAFAANATPADLETLLSRASNMHDPVHEIRLAPMDPNSSAYRQLLAALKASGWVSFRYFCFGNWHLKIDSDWPAYLQSRPGEVRSTIKRMRKKFDAAGGTLEIIQTSANLKAAISAYIEIYSASWKVPEPYPEFMPGLIHNLAASGCLRLGIARLAGRPIAAQVWAVHSGRASIIKLAHRDDNTEYSAGTLLTALLMEHVIAIDQVKEVDYLIGDDAYKRNWMNERRERWGIVAYNPKTALGLLLLIRESLARTLKWFRLSLKA